MSKSFFSSVFNLYFSHWCILAFSQSSLCSNRVSKHVVLVFLRIVKISCAGYPEIPPPPIMLIGLAVRATHGPEIKHRLTVDQVMTITSALSCEACDSVPVEKRIRNNN